LLTRFRKSLSILVTPVARAIAKSGVHPNAVTLAGLAISFLAPPTALLFPPLLPLVIAVSAYMDVVDGALARISGRVSKRGAFLDSFSDRIEELMYLIALGLLGVPMLLVALTVATSYLVSYLRALGELRGVKMEGIGLFERGERVIVVLATSIVLAIRIPHAIAISTAMIMALTTLNIVTIVQRFAHVWRTLGEK